MPPEPLPWDRKDFFKERKYDRSLSESLGGGGVARWREAPSHPQCGSAELGRTPGHGKQGGWHIFQEESYHGSTPSPSDEKILGDKSCRSAGPVGDGKSGRSSREYRIGSLSQMNWRGHPSDVAAASLSGPGRTHKDVNEKRSVDDLLTYKSHPHSEFVNNSDQFHFKDQHDTNCGATGLGTVQFERENSLGSIDWKPLKWTRSGSLSSRGSGFSHSSSSKSMAVDSSESMLEAHLQSLTPIQSPPGDAATCMTSAASAEDVSLRKKPRLGWGEGLAKYEKKKVPDDIAHKNGIIVCESTVEPLNFQTSSMADRSPRGAVSSDCSSPATPSSVACSSSPGVEEKSFIRAANVSTTKLCSSPCPVSQNQSEGLTFNLENVGVAPIANLSSSLNELLQVDDQNSVDSGFVRSTAMHKLLLWKAEISKALEVTESEIDSLENELNSLISVTRRDGPCPASSCSLLVACGWQPSEEPCAPSNLIYRSAPFQLHYSGDMSKEKVAGDLEEALDEGKDDGINSPGTATSKFSEPLPLGKPNSLSDTCKHDICSGNRDIKGTGNLEVSYSVYAFNAGCSCKPTLSMDVGVHYDREDILCDSIVASNKGSAHRASEVFIKLLPTNQCHIDNLRIDCSPCLESNRLMKEKFAMRKRFQRFKERVITLKFRAFQQLWKEDLRLLSIRKCRAKSQKKFEFSLQMVHSGYQKHRSSTRSRFSFPAGNLRLVPTTEVINFTNRLLANSRVHIYRSTLNMPAFVLDKKQKMITRFITSNGLVEDPCVVEKEKSLINPWTSEEKEIFLEKLSTFGKNFRTISSFLDHKTTADCIEFYYKNHKSDYFQKTKKKPNLANQGKSYSTSTYLVTSGKRWNRERNAVSLDLLGAVSAIAANADDGIKSKQKCASRFFGTSTEYTLSRGEDGMLERSRSLDVFGNERETAAADVLAGIYGSLSSEAMSSCITNSIDPREGYYERKCQTIGSSMRTTLTPEVTQKVDNETSSDESCGEMDSTHWTDEEKSYFVQAVSSYGKDFAMISRCVRTRSRDQCKVFFSKARKCLGLDMLHPVPGNEGTPMSDDANGGESETEDACIVESGSVSCSDKSSSKMDEDLNCNLKVNEYGADHSGTLNMHPDHDQLLESNRTGELNLQDSECNSKNFVSGDCFAEDYVGIGVDDVQNIESCVGSESLIVQGHENGCITSDTKVQSSEGTKRDIVEDESVISDAANDNGIDSVSGGRVEDKAVDEVYAESSRAEKAGHELLLHGNVLYDEQVEISDVSVDDKSSINCSAQDTGIVLLSSGNASLAAADTNSSGFVNPLHKNKNSMGLNPSQKLDVDSLQQGKCFITTNSVLQDLAAVKYEKSPDCYVAATLDFEKTSVTQSQSCATSDHLQQSVYGHSLLDRFEPSEILKGYPVSVSTKNGMNGDISCNRPSSLQSISKLDGKFQSGCLLPEDCYLQKCNGSKHDDVSQFHFLSHDQSQDHPRTQGRSLSESDKRNSNGDVKLFGQILSHPSAQKKQNYRAQECSRDNRGSQHAKLSDKSFNLSLAGNQNDDGIQASAEFNRNNYLGLENLPAKSNGFWDGNIIQTGFSSLPDSAMLMAKYPVAFCDYLMPSKMELQQSHSIGKVNDCNLNGVSVFSTGEISSSNKGEADYQVYRKNREGTKVPPFTVDTTQLPEILSEVQIRNEFDAMLSAQQQARGLAGIPNVMGREGILFVGGPCSGVSDPVAALKMHYAKAEHYGGQTGSILGEDGSWRGKGNVGSGL